MRFPEIQSFLRANDERPSKLCRPALLWFNLMNEGSCVSPLSARFSDFFDVRTVHKGVLKGAKNQKPPDFICFEYDYPDVNSLRLLKDARIQHPGTPIIMFTLQHSEELAVWALRNRVWDYYCKPVSDSSMGGLCREILKFHRSSESVRLGHSNRRKNEYIESSYPIEARFQRDESSDILIDTVLNFIDDNLGGKIIEKDVALTHGLSRFQFSRMFKKRVGVTFKNYLLGVRMEKSKMLLCNPNAKIIDVSYSVGFQDPSYFTRMFKRMVGVLPSEYSNKNNNFTCVDVIDG